MAPTILRRRQRRLWSFLNAAPVIGGIAVHNLQLQRTVIRRRERAVGAPLHHRAWRALDRAARGR